VPHGTFYETRLSSTVNIYEDRNSTKPVYTYNLKGKNRPIRSPSLCNDYFVLYSFYVPTMPPGNYWLTVTVVDESGPAPRDATKGRDFVVTATEAFCEK